MTTRLSVGDQVWVRTGLGPYEEPATVTELGDGGGDDITVRYNVSAIEVEVSSDLVRSMKDDNDGSSEGWGGRSRRIRVQTDRFGAAASAAAPAVVAAAVTPPARGTGGGGGSGRRSSSSVAAVTPSPSESPVPPSSSSSSSSSSFRVVVNSDDDDEGRGGSSGTSDDEVLADFGRRGRSRGPAKKEKRAASTGAAAGSRKKKTATAAAAGRSSAIETPPRKKRSRASARDDNEEGDDDDDEAAVLVESPYFSPPEKKRARKASASASASAAAKRTKKVAAYDDDDDDDGDDDDSDFEDKKPRAKPTAKKAKGAAKVATAKGASKGKAKTATKSAAKAKGKAKSAAKGKAGRGASAATSSSSAPVRPRNAFGRGDNNAAAAAAAGGGGDGEEGRSRAGQPDGNGGLDQPSPFTVEYSKTGRATCRRCDSKIDKGDLRVGHTPLFRGKPGFRVYRHLHCAIFSEDIACAEDVEGCSDLEPDDYDKLAARVEESMAELEREREELEPDELVQKSFQGEIRSDPKGLTANLLPFQVEGSSWMYHQEVKEPTIRGGILADEMGMGKTLQTIVTVLDHRPRLQHSNPGAKHPPTADAAPLKAEEELWDGALSAWKHEMAMNNVPKSILPRGGRNKSAGGARAGTLVICPVIALTQWKTEIERFTEPGSLTVCTYHGPNRSADSPREMLRKYDIVLTTYQVLEADMRKMISPNRVTCPNCGGKYKIDKLRIHLKYFCGEGAQRTEAQARTRRNDDDGGGGGGRGGRGGRNCRRGGRGGKKGGAGGTKKKMAKKTFADEKPKASTKKRTKGRSKSKETVSVKGGDKFDSESELSVDEGAVKGGASLGRPSRTAAKLASTKLASSAKNWMENAPGDESSDEYSEASSFEEESSDDEESSFKSPRRKKSKATKKAAPKASTSDEESEDTDGPSDGSDTVALKRAREKQRKALEAARAKNKGKKGAKAGKKAAKNKNSKKKKGQKKGKGGKKKFDDDPDSSSDSSRSSDSDDDDGIDMDALMEEAMAGSQMSVLHSLCWWRIVLDEAHMIKSRSSQTANAAFALIGIHRWCLSGTPLQNRVGEFYSLVRFLRLDPMANYFCRSKDCNCKSLHYRMMNGRCQDCGHGSVQHYSHFNKYVLNPIQRDGYSGDGRRAMFTLKNEVLDKCLLRRTKETKAEDMNLPQRIVTIRAVRLHPIEEDFYNALYTQTQSSFNDYVTEGTLLNNYAHIFDLLMRMRQSVDHPYLVVHSKKENSGQAGSSASPAVANGTVDCDICHEPPTDRVISSCCQAAFCRGCVLEYMTTSAGISGQANTPCPSCRAPFSIDLSQVQHDVVDDSTLSVGKRETTSSVGMPTLKELSHVATGSILRRINLAEFATSTKIEALTEELVMMRQTSPGSKAIVFSQFVNMLDLIRWRLHSDPCLADMGLGARALHGGMDVKARDASLKDFRENNDVRVLLMSLKAGGVALNLTVANHIYLMDPWWNPAAEMQAIDRTHRLGQHRAIRAVRFIAEDTVEERILQLQEKKRLVFDGTVGRDAGSLKMLTVDDMKSLFA